MYACSYVLEIDESGHSLWGRSRSYFRSYSRNPPFTTPICGYTALFRENVCGDAEALLTERLPITSSNSWKMNGELEELLWREWLHSHGSW